MSRELNRHEMGVGRISEVASALVGVLDTDEPANTDILAASRGLINLFGTEANRRKALCLAAAVVNTQFRKSCYLFIVDDKGTLHLSIQNAKFDREIMADAIGCD